MNLKLSDFIVRRIGIAVIASVMAVMLMPAAVFAGNINGPEAGLISQASGTFNYNGKSYVATSGALGQLRAYLSKDGIDLTSEQAAKASSMMYANIENGVIEGYLIPAGEGSSDTGSSSDSKTEKKDNKDSNRKKGITEEKAGSAVVTVTDKSSSFAVKSGKKELFKGTLPVKDTGFDLSPALTAAVMILLLIPAGIFVSVKLKLFAHTADES